MENFINLTYLVVLMKRQGMNASIKELEELIHELEHDLQDYNLELDEKSTMGRDKKWLVNIINKTPECSDTWEIEK